MTDQEILGDMDQFFIAFEGSFVVGFYNDHIAELPKVMQEMTGTARFELLGDDKKILSIQKVLASENHDTDWYLFGIIDGDLSDEVNKEVEEGLLNVITKTEFLLKYRELEDD